MSTPTPANLQDELDPDSGLAFMMFDHSPEAIQAWIEHYLTVPNELGHIVTMKLFPQQRRMLFDATGRDVTVKGRQTRASSLKMAANLRRMVNGQLWGATCVIGAQDIRLADGLCRRMDEIRPLDHIVTHTGENTQVVDVWSNGIRPVVKIVLPGEDSISVTPDHLVWSPNGWTPARDLSWVRIKARPAYAMNGSKSWFLPRQVTGRKQKRANGTAIEIPLSRDVGWATGLFLAEGTVTHSGLTYSLHEDEIGWVSRLQAAFPFATVRVSKIPGKRAIRVDVFSAALARLFKRLLYRDGDKVLPDNFWGLHSKHFAQGLIEGYVEGDGSLAKSRPTISVTSVRPGLVYQLRDLALSVYGVWGTIYRYEQHGFGSRDMYVLVWDSTAGEKLRQLNGWPLIKATQCPRNWRSVDGGVDVKVLGVVDLGEVEVFDMEVDSEDHSFSTFGAALHNCVIGAQDDKTTAVFRERIRHHLYNDLAQKNLKFKIHHDNNDELIIEDFGNRFLWVSGEQKTMSRGFAAQIVHLSEFAHWKDTALELLGGVLPSVPGPPYGVIDLESTPKGETGAFYKYAVNAKPFNPKDDFTVHLYEWWQEPRYTVSSETYSNADIKLTAEELSYELTNFEPDDYEHRLMTKHNLEPERILWRRRKKMSQDKTKAPFLQEYPEDLDTCQPPGSMVMTPTAMCEIEVLSEGDEVIGKDGLPHKIRYVTERNYEGPMLRFGVWRLPHIEMTPEHPVWVRRTPDSAPLWLEARHIQRGYYVWSPFTVQEKDLPPPWPFSPWLLGLWLAEGCMSDDKAIFCLHSKETDLAARVQEEVGGVLYFDKIKQSLQVRVANRGLVGLLRQFGGSALTKVLPSEYHSESAAFCLEVVKGWAAGDSDHGVIQGRSTLTLTGDTRSPQLAWSLWTVARRAGLRPSLRRYKNTEGNWVYYLYFSGRDAKQLSSTSILPKNWSGNRHRRTQNGEWLAVRSVSSYEYDGPVYNLKADGDYVSWGITVSNCWLGVQGKFFDTPDGIDHVQFYRDCRRDPVKFFEKLTYKGDEVPMYNGFSIWEFPDAKDTYIGGFDAAGGGLNDDSDWSVFYVMSVKKEKIVARLRARVSPDVFALMICAIGTMFKSATVNGERSHHGDMVFKRMRELFYPNIYYHVDAFKPVKKGQIISPGMYPTENIRREVLEKFKAAITNNVIFSMCGDLVREMGGFTWQKVQQRVKAAAIDIAEMHDDTIFAAAYCWYIIDKVRMRIKAAERREEEDIVAIGPAGRVVRRSDYEPSRYDRIPQSDLWRGV